MKSLSILVLLGTISAILLGVVFAVTPVLAQSNAQTQETNLASSQPVAPVTGNSAAVSAAGEAAAPVAESNANADPGLVLASTFSVNLQKDTASAQAAQEAEAQAEAEAQEVAQSVASFDSFVASVSNGKSSQVTGIYVENVLAYSVVRQPSGNAAFVSEKAGEVTQFALAAQYGTQAFLAHNYLAGASFLALSQDQIVTVVYGDGSSQQYRISNVKHYQALSPNSTQSSFVDLDSGEQLSASNLFHSVYNSDNSVVLQTCIAQDGVSTWGRLFITAVPLS